MTFEKYSMDFIGENITQMVHKYLPWIYKDVEWLLQGYLSGVPIEENVENIPYGNTICPSIRFDPYSYVTPGYPKLAAVLGYRDV